MELISILTSVSLAILTAFYVWFTHKLVRETKAGNERAQEAFSKQIQLTAYPHLVCTIQNNENDMPILILRNSSDFPALDVDILTLTTYFEDDFPIEEFIQNHVQKNSNYKKRLYENDEGLYSVYGRMVYFEFPQKKQVTVSLPAPIPTRNISVLLQFRDLHGQNYTRTYWFFEENAPEARRYRLGSIVPHKLATSPRITFDSDLNLVSEDGSQLDEHVDKDFILVWQSAIPSGHLTDNYQGVEDQGIWEHV